ncbi:hypothetical protein AB6A40_008101 [Gnathostoma spinigerum]|uniref:Reverse transcriptase domain-containing protein n=1 Tax=Gnathostoma spinigerum TaxID=75299 RepID=A0ABD6EXH7_9BILA
MESIIKDNIVSHFMQKNLFSKCQFGFLRRHSTETQLLSYLHDIYSSVNSGKYVQSLYIDFAKAFDTISHPKLIYKLAHYGICGLLLSWCSSFLKDRSQRVTVNGVISHSVPVTSGVPQGTVLGPLFFLIYINDLPESTKVSCKLFADDVKFYCCNDSRALITAITSIEKWANMWQMKISSEKCSVIHFGHPHCSISYFINKHPIKSESSVKDLGVYISNDLSFTSHVDKIVFKASKMSNIIFRVFTISDINVFRRAYIAYVRPILDYCSSVYSPHTIADINLIENVQRIYTRRAFLRCGIIQSSYSERCDKFQIDTLELRRVKRDLTLVYKIINGLVDIDVSSIFSEVKNITRGHKHRLRCPFIPKSTKCKNYFSYRVCNAWNRLPDNCVYSPTLAAFTQSLAHLPVSTLVPRTAIQDFTYPISHMNMSPYASIT